MGRIICLGFVWVTSMRYWLGEKEGGPARVLGSMEAFRKTLEHSELEDLGFVGDPFTWRNNWREAVGYTRERLDKEVASGSWRCLFPLHKIINGEPVIPTIAPSSLN